MPPSTACLCLPRKGFPIHTPLFCYFSFILLFKYAFQSFCHQATLAIACPRFARLLLQLPIRGTPHIVACGAATAPALRGINYHAPRNPRFFYASVSIYYPLYKINCHLQPSSHQIWHPPYLPPPRGAFPALFPLFCACFSTTTFHRSYLNIIK